MGVSSSRTSVPNSVWYIVTSTGGSMAVIHSDDLAELLDSGLIYLAVKVPYEDGVCFEKSRAAICPRTVE
jgi:hypothetical protein